MQTLRVALGGRKKCVTVLWLVWVPRQLNGAPAVSVATMQSELLSVNGFAAAIAAITGVAQFELEPRKASADMRSVMSETTSSPAARIAVGLLSAFEL